MQRVGQKPALGRRSYSPASRHLVSTRAAATDRGPYQRRGAWPGLKGAAARPAVRSLGLRVAGTAAPRAEARAGPRFPPSFQR